MLYLKNELYLFADMIHQNEKTLKTIKDLFPIEALIKNLECPDLDIAAKTGLTRIFTSLFMNTEKLLLVKKPKTQRALGDDQVAGLRLPSFITSEQLENVKSIVNTYLKNNIRCADSNRDLSLHYEYLRLLSYLLNSDFLLGKVESNEEWKRRLTETYELLENAFLFCVTQLRVITEPKDTMYKKRTTTGNIGQVHDIAEDIPIISATKGLITEEQLADAGIL